LIGIFIGDRACFSFGRVASRFSGINSSAFARICRDGDGGSKEPGFRQHHHVLHVRRGRDPVGTDRELAAIVANASQGSIRTRTLGYFPASAYPGISQVTA